MFEMRFLSNYFYGTQAVFFVPIIFDVDQL